MSAGSSAPALQFFSTRCRAASRCAPRPNNTASRAWIVACHGSAGWAANHTAARLARQRSHAIGIQARCLNHTKSLPALASRGEPPRGQSLAAASTSIQPSDFRSNCGAGRYNTSLGGGSGIETRGSSKCPECERTRNERRDARGPDWDVDTGNAHGPLPQESQHLNAGEQSKESSRHQDVAAHTVSLIKSGQRESLFRNVEAF
jgi:hypothetical protein